MINLYLGSLVNHGCLASDYLMKVLRFDFCKLKFLISSLKSILTNSKIFELCNVKIYV